MAWNAQPPHAYSRDIIKMAEFSGGKGFGNPDDAESWLRALGRVVNINQWTREEAFEHVQSKLIGAAATWYRNREQQFHANALGIEIGWQTFWSAFEEKFIVQDEQALWMQFESRTQLPDESVGTYVDAIRSMAERLGVNVNCGNVRSRSVKGLSHCQVKAKIENMLYLLPKTFDAVEAAASFQELAIRRDKGVKLPTSTSTSSSVTSGVSGERRDRVEGSTAPATLSSAEIQQLLEAGLLKQQRQMEASLQKCMLDIKHEVATQRQAVVRGQVDRMRQSKPDRPCFRCGSPDHFKRQCP